VLTGTQLNVFYTASGGDNAPPGERANPLQRLAHASGQIRADANGVWFTGFRNHRIIAEPEGRLYQTLEQSRQGADHLRLPRPVRLPRPGGRPGLHGLRGQHGRDRRDPYLRSARDRAGAARPHRAGGRALLHRQHRARPGTEHEPAAVGPAAAVAVGQLRQPADRAPAYFVEQLGYGYIPAMRNVGGGTAAVAR